MNSRLKCPKCNSLNIKKNTGKMNLTKKEQIYRNSKRQKHHSKKYYCRRCKAKFNNPVI